MPVQRLALDGPQMGAALCAFENLIPSAASRDKFGVKACGCPPRPSIESFRSSQTMTRTLGLSPDPGSLLQDESAVKAVSRQASVPPMMNTLKFDFILSVTKCILFGTGRLMMIGDPLAHLFNNMGKFRITGQVKPFPLIILMIIQLLRSVCIYDIPVAF